MDNALREIDNSEDYTVYNGVREYNGNVNSKTSVTMSAGFNSGDEEKTYRLNLANALDNFNPDEDMSDLEREFNTCCDRCGSYVGWDKWSPNYYNSTRSPGLCERCTRLLETEFGDRHGI